LTLRARETYTAQEVSPLRRLFICLFAAAICTLGNASAPAAQSQKPASDPRTRDIYVSVLDAKGAPVQGLGAADFTVREDGTAREVLKAGPATAPMQIAVLIDDSQAATQMIQPLRQGLTAFVDLLAGKAEIALITFGERPTTLSDYTTSAEQLKRGIGRLFSRPGSGPYLLDAIVDASRGLARREARRPVMIAITIEGIEFSNRHYTAVLEEVQKSRAMFHALAIGAPAASLSEEMRNRGVVLAEGTERTGGRRDQLLSEIALPDRLKMVAHDLLNQYVVTYARPESLIPPETVDVGVTRTGLTVRAPTRVANP
jgi:VWFA-related protein